MFWQTPLAWGSLSIFLLKVWKYVLKGSKKTKPHQILSPGKLKPISTVLPRNDWNVPENLNDGPSAGMACSPTRRHSLLYRQALQETKGTSFCLSFLNTALVHRHVCVHKRIKQANLFVWLKTFNCLFLSILWFCYYWRHTINEGENYMEAE